MLWAANMLGRLIGTILRIPVISALHALPQHEGAVRTILGRLMPQPTLYCAVSRSIKECQQRAHSTAIIIIPNGIEIAPEHNPIHIDKNSFVIGSVGRFVPVKNYHMLLTSFSEIYRQHPHSNLILIGHGPLEQKLRAYARALEIDHAVTFIINEPAAEYYHMFDCFVQCSDYEGLSMALLEAMSNKISVIATGNNNTHDVIEHEHDGIIIPPGNQEALTIALKRYLINPDLRSLYAQRGYDKCIAQYTVTTMCKSYDDVFKNMHKIIA